MLNAYNAIAHFDDFSSTSTTSLSNMECEHNLTLGRFNRKRAFDIIFSTVVVVSIISWLIPFIALLIKLESKDPVFLSSYELKKVIKHSTVSSSGSWILMLTRIRSRKAKKIVE